MIVEKNALVKVTHVRKGVFEARALRKFDTEKEVNYPLMLVRGTVKGTLKVWDAGERIPCRNSLCTIKTFVEENHERMHDTIG